jgi:hypothetical protein
MNEGTSPSSSTSVDLHTPAFEWGDGHSTRFAVAELLTRGQYAAPTIVVIDSCFTQAVYGQHAEKHNERRIHHMGTLHVNNARLNGDADLAVLRAYEFSKDALFAVFVNSTESFKAAKKLAESLINHFPKNVQTKIGTEALSW